MPFIYCRTVHFPDTDAAGVVFFANYLAICHEAYEEALGAAGINLATFFSNTGTVIPIARSEASYKRPLACGDRLEITVAPRLVSRDSFEVNYELFRLGPSSKSAAVVRTEHVCISSTTRARTPLPAAMTAWINPQ